MEVLCPTRGKRNETDYYGRFLIWRNVYQTESNFVSILSSHLCMWHHSSLYLSLNLLCMDLKWMWKSSVCWVQYVLQIPHWIQYCSMWCSHLCVCLLIYIQEKFFCIFSSTKYAMSEWSQYVFKCREEDRSFYKDACIMWTSESWIN